VERERAIVIASPERQEARLEQGLSARRVRAIRRRQSTIGPLGTFLQPLRRHPKRRERAREAERLVRPPFIDEPSERSEQFAVSLLDPGRGGLAVQAAEARHRLFGEMRADTPPPSPARANRIAAPQ